MGLREIIEAGVKKHQAKDFNGALDVYDMVLGRVVSEPYVLHLAGTLFLDLQKYGIAAQLLMRCVETSPPLAGWMADTYMNLGVAMRHENHEEEAIACYRRSLELNRDSGPTWANLGGVYVNYGQPEKCIEYSDKALSLNPNDVHAKHNRAIGLLELEKYEAGFKAYESRLEIPAFHKRSYDGPMWDGKKTGTLVVHGEQGLGDEVMFCSLIPRCKELAEKVVVECNHKLIPVFERSFGVKCYPGEKELKEKEKGDSWIPMGSLPRIFNIKSPIKHEGYLKADPQKVEKFKGEGFRIGLSWRGGTKKTHEQLRNFEIDHWLKLLDPRFNWVSVQYGDVKEELQEMKLIDPGWSGDMDDFAALVQSCDHIITVCNTTVHFAGALNKPCWVLVPNKPAWRYGTTSEKMLWYPSVRMIRQGKDESWGQVIDRVRKDLETL